MKNNTWHFSPPLLRRENIPQMWPNFRSHVLAPPKDPKEILTVLFHCGVTNFKDLLRKTGMNEKTLYRNLAKLKRGKTIKRKKGSGTPKIIGVQIVHLPRKNTRTSGTSFRRSDMLMSAHAQYWFRVDEKPQKKISKLSPSTMAWGAVSGRGFYITLIQGNVNSQEYIRIISGFLPYAEAIYPDNSPALLPIKKLWHRGIASACRWADSSENPSSIDELYPSTVWRLYQLWCRVNRRRKPLNVKPIVISVGS